MKKKSLAVSEEYLNPEGCDLVISDNSIVSLRVNGSSFQVPVEFSETMISHLRKKKVLKAGMGRNKGSSFELDTASKFSMWWYNCKKVIRRTPMSGGWSRTMASGDLICELDSSFLFSIECKHSKSWSFNDLFTADMGTLGKYWDQCRGESPDNKIPILVFRGNYGKTYVMLPKSEVTMNEKLLGAPIVELDDPSSNRVIIFTLDALLKLDPISLLKNNVFTRVKISPETLESERIIAFEKFGSTKHGNK